MVQHIASGALAFSASYIAILAALHVVLTWRVIAVRRAKLIGIGDGGDKDLIRRIRVQGNFVETAPFLMILLLALPLVGAPVWAVHVIGVLSVTGRVLHAIGLSKSGGTSFGRVAGMVMTLTALLLGAASLLFFAWR
jgi:uncharacterized protein